MNKPSDPRELAIDLLPRSICSVQVAAVICDAGGNILSWGWNHVGSGLGTHAEDHAIHRANRNRLYYGDVYVAGRYKRGTLVSAKPCRACQHMLDKFNLFVHYRGKDGKWRTL